MPGTWRAANSAGEGAPSGVQIKKGRLRYLSVSGPQPTGVLADDLTEQQAPDLAQIEALCERHQYSSFANSTLTSALLDRLLHHAETVVIEGRPYRMHDQQNA